MNAEPRKESRIRGREITRLEALSDAVFGFAAARWRELDLDEIERLEARFWERHYLIFVGVGCLSIAIVLAGGSLFLSGMIYGLLGPLCHWNGVVARRRTKEAARRLAMDPG